MTDVLRALEYTESETGKEVTSCQQTGRRSKGETGVFLQEVGQLVQLRDLGRGEDVVILQHFESVPVFHAEVFRHKVQHVVENCGPSADFVGGVFDMWDRVSAVYNEQTKRKRYHLHTSYYID